MMSGLSATATAATAAAAASSDTLVAASSLDASQSASMSSSSTGNGADQQQQQQKKKTKWRNQDVLVVPGECGILEKIRKTIGKGRARDSSPHVLPTTMRDDDGQPHMYTGTFFSYCVWISKPKDMAWLYRQGYFGKGMLSKSEPEYAQTVAAYKAGTSDRLSSKERKLEKKKKKEERKASAKRKQQDDLKGTSTSEPATKKPALDESAAAADESDGDPLDASGTGDALDVTGVDEADTPAPSEPEHGFSEEFLQLDLVEAFFLVHALGCLTIHGDDGQPLSTSDCWRLFREAQPDFVSRYVVYLHLRSCGWVPKSGLKFGVDFLAYRRGPAHFHASYSILVRNVNERTLEIEEGEVEGTRQPSWASLSNLSRMSGQVAKEVVFCHVLWPDGGLSEDILASPDCIKSLKVQQVLTRRWVPEKTRGEDEKEVA